MRILIAEDDKLFALDLQDMLQSWGHDVVGPFDTLQDCRDAIAQVSIDLAILDISLKDGDTTAPVAAHFRQHGVPIFVISGHSAEHIDEAPEFAGLPKLIKPINDDMVAGLLQALEKIGRGKGEVHEPV